MLESDEFSPVAGSGTVERATFRTRRRVRESLPSAERGFVHVVIGNNGMLISETGNLGADERYFFPGGTWTKVDVREREMTFAKDYSPSSTPWTFSIRMVARLKVTDPVYVAQESVAGVRSYVDQEFGERLSLTLSNRVRQDPPWKDVREERTLIERAAWVELRQSAPWRIGAPAWLDVTPVSISVTMDKQTAQHLADLEQAKRAAELAQLRHREQQQVDAADFDKRKQREAYLRDNIGTRHGRALIRLASDSVDEDMASVLESLDAADLSDRDMVLSFLQTQLAANKLDGEDQVVKELIGALLQGKPSQSPPVGAPVGAGSAAQEAIGEQAHGAHDYAEPASAGEPGDREWGEATEGWRRGKGGQ